jgi:hypothetical protein
MPLRPKVTLGSGLVSYGRCQLVPTVAGFYEAINHLVPDLGGGHSPEGRYASGKAARASTNSSERSGFVRMGTHAWAPFRNCGSLV